MIIVILIGVIIVNSYLLIESKSANVETQSKDEELNKETAVKHEINKLNSLIQKEKDERKLVETENEQFKKQIERLEALNEYYIGVANAHTVASSYSIIEALKRKDVAFIKELYSLKDNDRTEILLEYKAGLEIKQLYESVELDENEAIISELLQMVETRLKGQRLDDYYFVEDIHGPGHQNIVFKLADSFLWMQFDWEANLSKIRWTIQQPNLD